LRAEVRGSAPDAGKIPGVLGMQSGLNSVSIAVGAMEQALYSSYTLTHSFENGGSYCHQELVMFKKF